MSISHKDVYETFWRCRDFELSHFWQRAVFLGTFMTLAYVAYGTLLLKLFEHSPISENHWTLFHCLAIGIALFGATVSALWVLMAKGSKAWYEWHEANIDAFVATAPSGAFERNVRKFAGFNLDKSAAFLLFWQRKQKDPCYLSLNNGPFSVSKIIILIGVLSLVGWGVLSILHFLLLMQGKESSLVFLKENAIPLAFALIFIVLSYLFFALREHVHSTSLNH